jgi:hypothetical protein
MSFVPLSYRVGLVGWWLLLEPQSWLSYQLDIFEILPLLVRGQWWSALATSPLYAVTLYLLTSILSTCLPAEGGDITCTFKVKNEGNWGFAVDSLTPSEGCEINKAELEAKNNILEPLEEVTVTVTRLVTQSDFDTDATIPISLKGVAVTRGTSNIIEDTAEVEAELPLKPSIAVTLTATPRTVTTIGEPPKTQESLSLLCNAQPPVASVENNALSVFA